MDHVSPSKRSDMMRAVRSKNSAPELQARRLIHRLGYRFRLHAKELPGSPDVVFRRRKKAIFIHGCYWHGHIGCPKARLPKSRIGYWEEKIAKNRARDARNKSKLAELGWDILVLWQCQLKDLVQIEKTIAEFMSDDNKNQTACH